MKNLNEVIISEDKTILDAINHLNKLTNYNISKLTLFVKSKNEKIIGTITDGDIRRALIKNKDINQKINQICNSNFFYANSSNEFLDFSFFREKGINVLPILDDKKRLVKTIDLKIVSSKLPLECVIMAGGRGKRLSPLTDKTPKPMLKLGNKPIIEHNIDRLISFGIEKIYISVKYLGNQIIDYFGDGSSKNIKIEYLFEEIPLGTAGSLSLVEKFNKNHILVMNSDLFTNVNIKNMYLKLLNQDADMVVASTSYKIDIPYAILESDKNFRINSFKEKPSYNYNSNAGIYLLKKELIRFIPKNSFYDITDLMKYIVDNGMVLLHDPIIGYWIDIGQKVDYERANELIKYIK